MNLPEFYDLLEAHDWTYGYSDDHAAWNKGREEMEDLMRESQDSRTRQLYYDYASYIWKGTPKPERPTSGE